MTFPALSSEEQCCHSAAAEDIEHVDFYFLFLQINELEKFLIFTGVIKILNENCQKLHLRNAVVHDT